MLAGIAGAIPTDCTDRYDGDPPLPGRSAMERLDEIALYRFRVRTADGREAVSRVVATRRPVAARLGSEDEMTSLAAEEEHPPMLANPRWSSDSFAHGDRASLQVDAPGLDGRTVRDRKSTRLNSSH